jgi:hypothetical protein
MDPSLSAEREVDRPQTGLSYQQFRLTTRCAQWSCVGAAAQIATTPGVVCGPHWSVVAAVPASASAQ